MVARRDADTLWRMPDRTVTALAGGVGAARFLRGLVRVVAPESVTVIVNTGDDDHFHGLAVCPDLDSVTYTLAGASNPDTGWGLVGETFECMQSLERYGADTWFRLGDRDLATHLFRTERLASGATLSAVTAEITVAWRLGVRLIPMTDDPAPTVIVGTDGSRFAMQEWFVRERSEPPVAAVDLAAAERARPAPGVLDAIATADIVVICPSNPVISVAPILAVPGVRAALAARRDRVVAVTPIIGGRPVRGPADRLLSGLGIEVSAPGVASLYADVCSAFVVDELDAVLAPAIETLGVRAVVAPTLMTDEEAAATLAKVALGSVGRAGP